MHRAQPGSYCDNVPFVVRVRGSMDVVTLRRALDAVMTRHEMLRTTFELTARGPVQVIHQSAPVRCPVLDLSSVPPEDRVRAAQRAALDEVRRPFALSTETPLRAAVMRLTADEHLLAVTFHHIGSDGWSTSVFTRELMLAYAALKQGLPLDLGPLDLQFRDFVEREEEWLRSSQARTAFSHWRSVLSGAGSKRPQLGPAPLEGQTAELATMRLPDALRSEVVDRARTARMPVFVLLLAAVNRMALQHFHAASVCVGTMVAGRDEADSHGAIGLFLNTLLLRTDLSGSPSAYEHVTRAHQTIVEALQHRRAPFELVMRAAADVIQGAPHDLLNFILVHQQLAPMETEVAGLAIEPYELGEQGRVEIAAPLSSPIVIVVEQEADVMRIELLRRADFVGGGSAHDLLDRYGHALGEVAAGVALANSAVAGT